MNKKLVQRRLDLAAEELDRKGFRDLAERVDYYNSRLQKAASQAEVKLITRALERIDKQADERDGVKDKPERIARIRERLAKRREARTEHTEAFERIRRRVALRRRLAAMKARREERRMSPLAARIARRRRLREK